MHMAMESNGGLSGGCSAQATVVDLLEHLELGEPMSFENLTILPLLGGNGHTSPYTLSHDAIAAGECIITEVSEGGAVPSLKVENKGTKPVLLLSGDELVGAKQNRVTHVSIIIAAQTVTQIPVSCIEAGRWSYRSHRFAHGRRANISLRSSGIKSVRRSVREGRGYQADQGRVWREVDALHARTGTHSPTAAMSDSYTRAERDLSEFRSHLACPERATGLAAFINGRFVALELFHHPDVLRKVWDAEVESLAMDAMFMQRDGAKRVAAEQSIADCTARIRESLEVPRQAAGAGFDVGIEGNGVVGAALVHEGRVVHLQVFADPENDAGAADAEA